MINLSISPDEYVDHPHNTSIRNERCLEVVLGRRFIQQYPDTIEIGSTMPYYGNVGHRVIDRYDKKCENSEQVDAETISCKGKNVLCLSTVGYMGSAVYYDVDKPRIREKIEPIKSVRFIRRVSEEANDFLFSFPLNCHFSLDQWMRQNLQQFRWTIYARVYNMNPLVRPIWIQTTDMTAFRVPYGTNWIDNVPDEHWAHSATVIFLTKKISSQ